MSPCGVVVRLIRALGAWLDRRLQLADTIREVARHRVPRSTASWFYVFGSVTFVLFLLQIVTGVVLAFSYVPSAAEAWNSLQTLNHDEPGGWFLRAVHGWGSTFMVALVLIHMVQVFLFGAFKYPRELTWMTGVLLLLLTLGMAFTGQVLRFDQDAYWGLGIGASIMGRVPLVGARLVHLLLGGPIIAGDTLSHFFSLHVFIVPGLLLALAGLHVLMVLTLGINEWPMPGRLVTRDRYLHDYEELVQKDGIPFVPDAFQRDLVAAGLAVLAVLGCAALFGPFGPSGPPNPTIIQTTPRPDFFFLWLYAALSLLPRNLETPLLLTAPVIGIGVLFVLPLLSGFGEKSWRRRPLAVLTVLLVGVSFAALTRLGQTTPWSPVANAWSGAPVPARYLEGRSPLERQGALVLQNKQCRNCHALDSMGGRRGPALDEVASRLTVDELIRQVLQGGGNMPAYGKNLSPPEVTALVSFLETLRGDGLSPARNPAEAALPPSAASPGRNAASPGR
ncbi:MAG: Cytochrome b/b6, N-terminal domain [Myxococcales bacterium]|nr:Cytochrome b/b6, N-terminal domain [Myxococcales bacterium]